MVGVVHPQKCVDCKLWKFSITFPRLPQLCVLQGLSVEQQLQYYDAAKEKLRKVSNLPTVGHEIQEIYEKFLQSEGRNPGIKHFYKVQKILNGDMFQHPLPPIPLEDVPLLRYAPLTSVDCERSFRQASFGQCN